MLNIRNLKVNINEKTILKDFNLKVEPSEIHVIMGPNGTGKSTLSRVLMGDKKYKVNGKIEFLNNDLTKLQTNEISKLGIFLAMQLPPEIDGISNADFLRASLNCREEKFSLLDFIKDTEKCLKDLKMKDDMIHRSINKGFSGGEKKKNEILQLKILKPKFIILDEIDSGLDVDSLNIVCENINDYLKENKNTSVLIITHYPRILKFLKPDYVHIMVDGKIVDNGSYPLALEIEKNGYDKYKKSLQKSNEG